MTRIIFQAFSAAVIIFASAILVEWAWLSHRSIFGLFAVSFGTLIALGWIQRLGPGRQWPLPPPPARVPDFEKNLLPSRARLLLAGGGIYFLVIAYQQALQNHYLNILAALVAAAFCWKSIIEVRERPVSARWQGIGMALVLAAAALFRFYKAGEIPVGIVTWDESLIYSISSDVVRGVREIFNMRGGDGQWPYWANAAAIKLFGNTIVGYRMSPAFSGFVMVGLIVLLGKELIGSRLGLIAGAFAAMAYWAVAYSRAEYLIASSYVPVLAALWLLVWGLKKGSPFSLGLAGFFFGWCFSGYNAVKIIPLMVIIFCGAVWWRNKAWREPLKWALVPFTAGAIIGLMPLILWAYRSPEFAYSAYFGKLNADYVTGADIVGTPGFIPRMHIFLSRILPGMDQILPIFTTHGDRNLNRFFAAGVPVIDRTTLFLMLGGIATCLARFRKPAYILLLCWWFLGFLPSLVSHWNWSRRFMMTLPATLFLAGIGFLTLYELFTVHFKRILSNRLLLLGSLAFFVWYGNNNWETYFIGTNQNSVYLSGTNANFVKGIRGVIAENEKSPVYLVNFRKNNQDYWLTPTETRPHQSHTYFLENIPRVYCQTAAGYFLRDGFYGSLKGIPKTAKGQIARDPLVVLTPFHFYLGPLLLRLGAEMVREIMPARNSKGYEYSDFGFAPHQGPVYRMYRFKNFDRAKLQRVMQSRMFTYVSEELTPPIEFGNRVSLSKLAYNHPTVVAALKSYKENPAAWQAGRRSEFSIPDIYFWSTSNYLTVMPMRLSASWGLQIPKDGEYAFGAASSMYMSLKIDNEEVFQFMPDTKRKALSARDGLLGKPIFLKAGFHRIQMEQVGLSVYPFTLQAIRLIWKPHGQKKETLPLELLRPKDVPERQNL